MFFGIKLEKTMQSRVKNLQQYRHVTYKKFKVSRSTAQPPPPALNTYLRYRVGKIRSATTCGRVAWHGMV